MNFRVVIVVFAVILFALGMGIISYQSGGAISLENAQKDGQISITQNTIAGTVPHTVTIKNSGNNTVKANQGEVLSSPNSQDLVLAEDITIPPMMNNTLKAYCLEPNQKANPGAELTANKTANPKVIAIIESTDASTNTTLTQLQIWNIVTGGNVDPFTGEAAALVQTQKITFTKLRQDLSTARQQVLSQFNLTEEQLKNVQNITNENSAPLNSWMEGLRLWIKNTLGL